MAAADDLLVRLKRGREFKVTIGKFVFIVRRPTDADFQDLARRGGLFVDIATNAVVGWEGITENDMIGGGGSDAVAFDVRVWREWCADRAVFWEPIALPVVEAYEQHKKELEDAAKNSAPGSN